MTSSTDYPMWNYSVSPRTSWGTPVQVPSLTYVLSPRRRIRIDYADSQGNVAHAYGYIASGATASQLETLCNAMQTLTDLSIISFAVIQRWDVSAPVTPATLGAGHSYAMARYKMSSRWTVAGATGYTYLVIPGPHQYAVYVLASGQPEYSVADPDMTEVLGSIQAAAVDSAGHALAAPTSGEWIGYPF